jgi:hypothetical protein
MDLPSSGIGGSERIQVTATPPGASGGACQSSGVTTMSGVTYAADDRVCTPDSPSAAGCSGAACTTSLPSPYLVCVKKGGAQSCPAPFTEQHVVGSGATYTCSACDCTTSATCTGTLKLFTDTTCRGVEVDIPADGTCQQARASGMTYVAYEYAGDPPMTASCMSTGTSTAQSITLKAEETICCVP